MDIRHRAVAIIIKNNKLLLVKGKGFLELWTPGGKIEKGESDEETIKRELKEEINLEIKSVSFFKEYFMENPYNKNGMTKTRCYLTEAEGEPKAQAEIDSIVWYSKEDFENKKYRMIEENQKGLIPDLIKAGLLY